MFALRNCGFRFPKKPFAPLRRPRFCLRDDATTRHGRSWRWHREPLLAAARIPPWMAIHPADQLPSPRADVITG